MPCISLKRRRESCFMCIKENLPQVLLGSWPSLSPRATQLCLLQTVIKVSLYVSAVGEWGCGMWSVQNILPLSLLHPQALSLLQHKVCSPSMGCSPSQNEILTVQNSPSPCPYNGVQTVQTSGVSFFKLAGISSCLTKGSFWAQLTGAFPAMYDLLPKSCYMKPIQMQRMHPT